MLGTVSKISAVQREHIATLLQMGSRLGTVVGYTVFQLVISYTVWSWCVFLLPMICQSTGNMEPLASLCGCYGTMTSSSQRPDPCFRGSPESSLPRFPAKIKKKNCYAVWVLSRYGVDLGVLAFHTHKIDILRIKEQLLTPPELGDIAA